MMRSSVVNWLCSLVAAVACAASPAAAQYEDVIRELNRDDSVTGVEDTKSYKILFDAYLRMTPPPMPVGPRFGLSTIHPKMADWSKVSGWAESNPDMAKAIIASKDKKILGLPYGPADVSSAYREAGLVALIGVNGSLRNTEFAYLKAMETIAAFATAESYRLMDANKVQESLDLAIANVFVLRQLCDRQFISEKTVAFNLLNDALLNLRIMFYQYNDKIGPNQYTKIAKDFIPSLRPTRNYLEMPEGEHVVAKALLNEVFDKGGQADQQAFTSTFAAIQSADEPLTRFGAARRWANIALVHGSLDASLERLKLIYDDWWRRWRVQEYEPILDLRTQFESTNPIRYAAVVASLANIENLFLKRNQLVAMVNGTAMAAGLCAYKQQYGTYPNDAEKTYGQFVRKSISDIDPFDKSYGTFRFRRLDSDQSVDTPAGRVWIKAGEALLYARGVDHADNMASNHTEDGSNGDIVIWPPIRALEREAGLVK